MNRTPATPTRPGLTPLLLLGLGLLAATGCGDWPWPLNNPADPARCQPACAAGTTCRQGRCVGPDLEMGGPPIPDGDLGGPLPPDLGKPPSPDQSSADQGNPLPDQGAPPIPDQGKPVPDQGAPPISDQGAPPIPDQGKPRPDLGPAGPVCGACKDYGSYCSVSCTSGGKTGRIECAGLGTLFNCGCVGPSCTNKSCTGVTIAANQTSCAACLAAAKKPACITALRKGCCP